MQIHNKIILITGSSNGIGRAAALLFAKKGAKIIVNYIHDEENARRVVKEIVSNSGDAIMIKAELTKLNYWKLP